MAKRSIPILFLTVAFLLSAWGNVIAAAFCPHYLFNRSCCQKRTSAKAQQVERQESCHHHIDDMGTGDMQIDESEMESYKEPSRNSTFADTQTEVDTEAAPQQVVIDLPTDPCGHCWMHSQPASGTTTLVGIDPLKQLVETNAPPAESSIFLPHSFTVCIAPLEHGPPGNALPRHVLMNVFRI